MTSPHGSTAICRQITPEMGWDREATAGPDPACRRAPSPGSLLLPALPTGIFPELCHAPTTGATCVGGQRKRGIFQCWKPRGKRLQDGTINAARVNHYSSSPPLPEKEVARIRPSSHPRATWPKDTAGLVLAAYGASADLPTPGPGPQAAAHGHGGRGGVPGRSHVRTRVPRNLVRDRQGAARH